MQMDILTRYGQAVRKIRLERGISQEELCFPHGTKRQLQTKQTAKCAIRHITGIKESMADMIIQQNTRFVMQAYGFDVAATTKTSCMAGLMRIYQKLADRQRKQKA